MITSVWTLPGELNEPAALIRTAVFCEELGMDPALERDAFEPFSFQLALLLDDVPVAAGRFYLRALGKAQIDRVCVLPAFRRQGIGDGLIKILDFKAACEGIGECYAEVPEQYLGIFRRIGFTPEGECYEKDGQRLQTMRKESNDGTKGHCAHQ